MDLLQIWELDIKPILIHRAILVTLKHYVRHWGLKIRQRCLSTKVKDLEGKGRGSALINNMWPGGGPELGPNFKVQGLLYLTLFKLSPDKTTALRVRSNLLPLKVPCRLG